MKKMKLLFPVLALCASLSACAGTSNTPASSGGGRLSIVATIFPEYDWVIQILGDQAENVDVTLLLDSGADLHSFQPTAADIRTIAECDLFIHVGGESDEWVEDALQEAVNPNMHVVTLLDVLKDDVREEEVIEGMQEEEHEHEHEEGPEYDEHVWLSLKRAKTVCMTLAEELASLDPDHADTYRTNAKAYAEKLDALDQEYAAMVSEAPYKTVLFGDRFPFRYLADDYGLQYYAAFVGCSAESEASFETIIFLAGKVDELQLPVILTIEGDNHRIAETIWENTSAKAGKTLVMDSMQSVTALDVKNGTSYLSIMEQNLDTLKQALNP